MNISFIGGGKRVENYCRIFQARNNFNIVGFYCNPIKECTDIAIETNSCLFSCIDDLCNVSDIIFIATEDEVLPSVIRTLTKLHIHNKIIIGIAKNISASDLDNGYENTYAVIDSSIEAEILNPNDISNTHFLVNGFGKKYDELISLFEADDMNIQNVSKPELELFRTSCHFMTYGIRAVYKTAEKLCKIATGSDNFNLLPLLINSLNNFDSSKCMYKNGRLRDIKEITDVLDSNGVESVSSLYKAIGEVTVENWDIETDVADEIYKILRKK